MQMTNGEIITSYRQAKDPAAQINILAELNGSTPAEIRRILAEGGQLATPEQVSDTAPTHKQAARTAVDSEKLSTLYKQGCTDKEIIAALGISKSSAARWRKQQNLPPNRAKAYSHKTVNHAEVSQAVSVASKKPSCWRERVSTILTTLAPGDTEEIKAAYKQLVSVITEHGVTVEIQAVCGND